MNIPTKRLTIALAVASTLMASTAGAQEADDTAKSQNGKSAEIQTVVVTAQKRKEDVNKVPISISVIGGDQLAAQHIGDYADITRSIPNISFSGGGGGVSTFGGGGGGGGGGFNSVIG